MFALPRLNIGSIAKTIPAFKIDLEIEKPEEDEKIVFELIDDEVLEMEVKEPVLDENELIVISEFIKNLDVTFEIVSPEKPLEFEVSKPVVPEVNEIKVIEATEVIEEQVTFSFDLPISAPVAEVDENKILFELSNETKNIEVNQAVQVVPMTELNENGIIKYSLEEYM